MNSQFKEQLNQFTDFLNATEYPLQLDSIEEFMKFNHLIKKTNKSLSNICCKVENKLLFDYIQSVVVVVVHAIFCIKNDLPNETIPDIEYHKKYLKHIQKSIKEIKASNKQIRKFIPELIADLTKKDLIEFRNNLKNVETIDDVKRYISFMGNYEFTFEVDFNYSI